MSCTTEAFDVVMPGDGDGKQTSVEMAKCFQVDPVRAKERAVLRDDLALLHAETGDLVQALTVEREALARAEGSGNRQAADATRARIAAWERGR